MKQPSLFLLLCSYSKIPEFPGVLKSFWYKACFFSILVSPLELCIWVFTAISIWLSVTKVFGLIFWWFYVGSMFDSWTLYSKLFCQASSGNTSIIGCAIWWFSLSFNLSCIRFVLWFLLSLADVFCPLNSSRRPLQTCLHRCRVDLFLITQLKTETSV